MAGSSSSALAPAQGNTIAPALATLADLRSWIGRSEVHTRVWNSFSRCCRSSDDDPVMVDEDRLAIFKGVREELLSDAFDEEIQQLPCEVGQLAQRWRVRESFELPHVLVRAIPDLDSQVIGIIMPGQDCIQRGALVLLEGQWTGVSRMPIYPRGWITFNSEAAGPGGIAFVEEIHEHSALAPAQGNHSHTTPADRWICTRCTLENEAWHSQCNACSEPHAQAGWSCSVCTFLNEERHSKCNMCDEARPQGRAFASAQCNGPCTSAG